MVPASFASNAAEFFKCLLRLRSLSEADFLLPARAGKSNVAGGGFTGVSELLRALVFTGLRLLTLGVDDEIDLLLFSLKVRALVVTGTNFRSSLSDDS